MEGPALPFPRRGFIAVSMAGIATFSALLGAGVTGSGFSARLRAEPDILVTLIGSFLVGGGLVLTSMSLRADAQAKRDEARSRRIEQYAARIREFRTIETNAAIMMLLNFDRDVILREGEAPRRCCWDETAMALVPGLYRHYLYEPELTQIRDCFNDLLEGMSRLHFLLTQNLLMAVDVDSICAPILIRLILDPKFAQTPLARNLRLYILWRNPRGVLHLCERYSLPIKEMRDADVAELTRELKAGHYGPWEPTGWGNLDTPPSTRV